LEVTLKKYLESSLILSFAQREWEVKSAAGFKMWPHISTGETKK